MFHLYSLISVLVWVILWLLVLTSLGGCQLLFVNGVDEFVDTLIYGCWLSQLVF